MSTYELLLKSVVNSVFFWRSVDFAFLSQISAYWLILGGFWVDGKVGYVKQVRKWACDSVMYLGVDMSSTIEGKLVYLNLQLIHAIYV